MKLSLVVKKTHKVAFIALMKKMTINPKMKQEKRLEETLVKQASQRTLLLSQCEKLTRFSISLYLLMSRAHMN